MCVSQNNRFYFIGGDVKIAVFFVSIIPFSLKRTAVNKERPSVNFKNMLGASNLLGGS